jgi:hypothetical protein
MSQSSFDMPSTIHVFLFGEVINHLLLNQHTLTEIENDLKVSIDYIKQKKDDYLKITGQQENVHRARIILQEIERTLYRESYLSKI